MSTSLQTQAVLLMTVWFSKAAKDEPKPLTPAEWGRFAAWLKSQERSPEALMTSADPADCLQGWLDRSITPDRIRYLLGRSGALGLALEKWQRAGLWVMTRSDADYPSRLKKHLKLEAPPVLFGCGNRQLLDQGGVAVVGSRAARAEDLDFTSRLGAEIAAQGFSVVSGGASGVDETAMLGALEKEGTAAGVLADNLLRAALSAKYRKGLMSKNLVLASPFNPEAPFNVGNAMARNKYIYCLADAGVVVATSKETGGTWAGAIENLKHGWVPLWVKEHADPDSGNAALVERGARWLPSNGVAVSSLASRELSDTKPESSAPGQQPLDF
jgi:predicted Rossmann fold nucleotide-binding protein DprA/Smf involved in DNA uptake